MEELEEVIKAHLIGKTLADIECYNLMPHYFNPKPESAWIINGGVHLVLDDGQFAFAWDVEKEFFDILPDHIQELTDENKIEAMDIKEAGQMKSLVGQKIESLTVKWNFYHEYDENNLLKEERKYMPYEFVLHFSNGSTLQLATVIFDVSDEDINFLQYDSQGDLLVSVNDLFEDIQEEDDE
ncbi:MAG: hypothetical protein AAFX87_06705 [Bacteroidota bacterium]